MTKIYEKFPGTRFSCEDLSHLFGYCLNPLWNPVSSTNIVFGKYSLKTQKNRRCFSSIAHEIFFL